LAKVAEGGIQAENLRIVTVPVKTKRLERLSTEEIDNYVSKL
jgi:hypothetical protein